MLARDQGEERPMDLVAPANEVSVEFGLDHLQLGNSRMDSGRC
jgi:hypothetical protein